MVLRLFVLICSLFVLSSQVFATEQASAKSPASAPQDVGSEVGRYQLFNGTFKTFNLKSAVPVGDTSTGIFLIDTKTGVVKRYLNMIDENGKYVETWVTIDPQPKK